MMGDIAVTPEFLLVMVQLAILFVLRIMVTGALASVTRIAPAAVLILVIVVVMGELVFPVFAIIIDLRLHYYSSYDPIPYF